MIEIDLKGRTSGTLKTHCPKCSHTRKKKNDKSLYVNIDSGAVRCFHCDFKTSLNKKIYERPKYRDRKPNNDVYEWFKNERGFTQQTIDAFNITISKEYMAQTQKEETAINYNYYRGSDLINIKFRDRNKNFKLAKDCELIFYNLNGIKKDEPLTIVEGENDVLAYYEATGRKNCISVPNGAGSHNLSYVDNCWEELLLPSEILIATDNDTAGIQLREALANKIGKDRCKYAVWENEKCKDFNDLLLELGNFENDVFAHPFPNEGIINPSNISWQINDWYDNGFPVGERVRHDNLSNLIKFAKKELTTISGAPGSFKTAFLDDIILDLTFKDGLDGWKGGIFSFETEPSLQAARLAGKLLKSNWRFCNKEKVLSTVSDYILPNFHFFDVDIKKTNTERIFEDIKRLKFEYNIDYVVVDPWNRIEHHQPKNMTESQYVGTILTKFVQCAKENDIHIFLIAHPTKMPKQSNGDYEIGSLYNISGSANFFNMTYNGIWCHRRRSEENDNGIKTLDIFVQKVKHEWNGDIGHCKIMFDTNTGQMKEVENDF